MVIATSEPADYDNSATRWSLDDIAATILNEAHDEPMGRSTIWRILEEADLKPHKSVYWLNSHDPDFESIAREIGELYVQAPAFYWQGRLILSSDEQTGMQILQRKYPTQPLEPGKPEKREHEYIRQGTRALIASFAVPTGEGGLESGRDTDQSRFRCTHRSSGPALSRDAAVRWGAGQFEHALEPGCLLRGGGF